MHTVDLVVKQARIYVTGFQKFVLGDLYVDQGRCVYIGTDTESSIYAREVIDASGRYLIPGLIDCHMHIESSMMTPGSFAAAAVRCGVTTVIAEPHEIANVFGLDGILQFWKEGQQAPMSIYLAIPSCVPSTEGGLETTGGEIGLAEVETLLGHPDTRCLGEVMNGRTMLRDPRCRTNRIIDLVRKLRPDIPIEGHVPAFMGEELARLKELGVGSDHTEQTPERIRERIKNGVFVQLQRKSLTEANIEMIHQYGWWEHIALVTDDTMPDVFLHQGHLNAVVAEAVRKGLPLEKAIYMASYTPARHMRLQDVGALEPGNYADFVILENSETMSVYATYYHGKCVYMEGAESSYQPDYDYYPEAYRKSVHVPARTEHDFAVFVDTEEDSALCRVLHVKNGTTFLTDSMETVPVKRKELCWEDTNLALLTVTERHGRHGNRGVGLVTGDCLQAGAVATTYAHDHHNLLVLGHNKADMTLAANTVLNMQGGIAVVKDGVVLAKVALPIAGIVSQAPLEVLGNDVASVVAALQTLGYKHNNVIMSLSTLGLPVSPEYKVTDQGIVDVKQQKIVPLIL